MKGREGSPVNFTWEFSGDAITAEWGIKKSGANDFTSPGKILTVRNGGSQTLHNINYAGRVTGDLMSGQVVFAFNAVKSEDMNTYLCILRAGSAQGRDQYDYVNLIVEGTAVTMVIFIT